MSTFALAVILVISVLGSLAACLVALFRDPRAHRLSNGMLALAGICGVIVGVALATSTSSSLVLPEALYSAAAAGESAPSWSVFYDMVFGLDRFSAIFYALISVVTLFVAVFTIPYLEYETAFVGSRRQLNALAALMVFGMQGVLLATNILGFMAFWELIAIVAVFLIFTEGSVAARKAGFMYMAITHIALGAVAAGLFLLSGGALLSDFSILAMVSQQLPPASLQVALALLLLGFAGLAGLVPFHVSIPAAYAATPAHVTALMSGALINLAVYGFLRVLLFLLPSVPLWFILAVIILGAVSALMGVLYAVVERDIKRLLTYRNSEYVGLVFAMIGIGLLAGQSGSVELTQAALYAALFLAATHSVLKTGLFLATGILIAVTRSRRLETLGGLARRMPQLSIAVCVLALASAALPPFGPFMAEWIFIQAGVGALLTASSILKVALVLILAVFGFVAGQSLFAMVKFYAIAFLANPRTPEAAAATEPAPGLLAPVVLLASLTVLMGLFAPVILGSIGAMAVVPPELGAQVLATGGGGLAPLTLFFVMLGCVLVLVGLRRLLTDVHFERLYQTWDGGQPLTPRMEYTATGLTAPVRYFFRFFLRTQKAVSATPLTPNNPWVSARSMSLLVNQAWYERGYAWVRKAVGNLANEANRWQNGVVQFYVSLALLTLFVTLLIAL